MGLIDAPDMVDYVLKKTKKDNLTFIAHSLGTTPMFASLADQNFIWKTKLNLFIALAPVTKLDCATSPLIQYTATYSKYIETTLRFVGIYEFFNIANSSTISYTCRLLPSWCRYTKSFLLTSNPELDD